MVCLVVNIEVQDGKQDEMLALVKPLVEASQKEEGCIEYNFYQQLDSPTSFAFIEKWKDQAALDFHEKQDHFTYAVPKMGPLCAAPPVVKKFDLAF